MNGGEPRSREPSPVEAAIESEETSSVSLDLGARETKALDRVWREMRWRKPHLYRVLKAYTEAIARRDSRTQYSHGVFRGFYSDLSKDMGVDESTVRYRLQVGIRWFAKRFKRHCKP